MRQSTSSIQDLFLVFFPSHRLFRISFPSPTWMVLYTILRTSSTYQNTRIDPCFSLYQYLKLKGWMTIEQSASNNHGYADAHIPKRDWKGLFSPFSVHCTTRGPNNTLRWLPKMTGHDLSATFAINHNYTLVCSRFANWQRIIYAKSIYGSAPLPMVPCHVYSPK